MKFFDPWNRADWEFRPTEGEVDVDEEDAKLRAARDFLENHPTLDFSEFLDRASVEELVTRRIGPTANCLSVRDLHMIALGASAPTSGNIGSLMGDFVRQLGSKLPWASGGWAHISACDVCAKHLMLHKRLLGEGRRLISDEQLSEPMVASLAVYDVAQVVPLSHDAKTVALTVMDPSIGVPGFEGDSILATTNQASPLGRKGLYLEPGSISVRVSDLFVSHEVHVEPADAPPGFARWAASKVVCRITMPIDMHVGDVPMISDVQVEARSSTGEVRYGTNRVIFEVVEGTL